MRRLERVKMSGRKILAGILIFVAVAVILHLKGFLAVWVSSLQPHIQEAMTHAGTSAAWSLWLGVLFGLVSCPVCGVPLAAYIAGGEGNVKAAFNASVIFTVGRFISFILLGVVTGIMGSMLPFILAPYAIGVAGVFMVALSADLLELIELREAVSGFILKRVRVPTFSVNHPVEYLVWGTVTGLVCTIEASIFLAPISAVAIASASMSAGILLSLAKAVAIIFAFAVGAFIPPTALILLARGSVSVAHKYMESSALKFARYVGAVLLLLLGVEYIAMGLNSATTLI
ncbi:MAG: hypothetical protein ABIH11_00265 [Candidatus Altiarchaeota archaeon]